jgi:hypothetical protein
MKKYFLSFCDTKFANTLQRLKTQAENMNVFDHILCLNEKFFGKDFMDANAEFVNKNKRGYGYWIWKSYFVLKILNNMNDGDLLVYADGGCSLNPNGLPRLNEYFQIVNQSPLGILSFQMGAIEKEWTKMDLFLELDCQKDEVMNSGQLIGTTFIMRKCDHVLKIFQKVYELCQKDNYHFLDDSPSLVMNCSTFKEHRHDQSILSLLRKIYGTEIIPDETYFKQFAYDAVMDGTNYPIWATRRKY